MLPGPQHEGVMFNSSILQINIDKLNLIETRLDLNLLICKDFALVVLLFRLNYSRHLMC